MKIAVISSHPVQYYAPLFRSLAGKADIHVFYAHEPTPKQQSEAGFGTSFNWDIDLTAGYPHSFLKNVSKAPSVLNFGGCDTPDIYSTLREGKFDAVLVLGWHLKALLQAIWASKRLRLPLLVRGDSQLTTPRTFLKKVGKALIYPIFLRLFDAALYVGSRNRAYFEHYRYPPSRLFYSPHCVDTERFSVAATTEARLALRSELRVGRDDPLILFAGKLIDFKRPLDCVDAISRLQARRLAPALLIAGSGPLEAALMERARLNGVKLYHLGFQNQTQMPRAYAAADALVLPSTGRETWGLVCNEALACGCPIVVSEDVGCAPDLAADSYVGRSYPMGDVEALSRELRDLLDCPPNRQAVAQFSDLFSLTAAAQGIVTAAEAAIRRRAGRGRLHNRSMPTKSGTLHEK